MKLDRLRLLDKQMQDAGRSRTQFNWKNGRAHFRVIYMKDVGDAFGRIRDRRLQNHASRTPWGVLCFVDANSSASFQKLVRDDFDINTYMGEDYETLKQILGSGDGGEKLEINLFFEAFANSIPPFRRTYEVKPHEIPLSPDVEESDRRYFLMLRDPRPRGKLSPENLRKTQILLGQEMANYCKRHGLSSCWSDTPGKYLSTAVIIDGYVQ